MPIIGFQWTLSNSDNNIAGSVYSSAIPFSHSMEVGQREIVQNPKRVTVADDCIERNFEHQRIIRKLTDERRFGFWQLKSKLTEERRFAVEIQNPKRLSIRILTA